MKSVASRPIGVFDSGIGGLTVVKEITRQLPHEDIVYFGDTARVPYGTKSPKTIQRYSKQISRFLIKNGVKAIVVACNSASAMGLSALKNLSVPVIGVIRPGARAAVRESRSGRVGVIGTYATIGSGAYRREIKKQNPRAKVWEKACPLFVPLVEEGWLAHPTTARVAREYLGPFIGKKFDALVLGCTHYPLLKPLLKKVVGKQISLIDSAEETARDVSALLSDRNLLNPQRGKGRLRLFVSDRPASFSRLTHRFLGSRAPSARRINLEP